jgi:chemotaxis protein histidine kinase CheA
MAMDTFQVMQQRFLAGLEGRVQHLTTCDSKLTHGYDRDIVTDMMRGFQTLAGIGSTHGFSTITDISHIGELTCRSLGVDSTAQDLQELSAIVDALAVAGCGAQVHFGISPAYDRRAVAGASSR